MLSGARRSTQEPPKLTGSIRKARAFRSILAALRVSQWRKEKRKKVLTRCGQCGIIHISNTQPHYTIHNTHTREVYTMQKQQAQQLPTCSARLTSELFERWTAYIDGSERTRETYSKIFRGSQSGSPRRESAHRPAPT